MVKIKRVYDPPAPDDGKRILVDRLWPRGVKKEQARLDAWVKEIAPSTGLRTWFAHDPSRWKDFRDRYIRELRTKPELVRQLRQEAKEGTVTLVFAAKDCDHANAVVLKEVLSH
jgi:uncharacterized protein YeaO (DUF488 family)